jgi:hypothetical protein
MTVREILAELQRLPRCAEPLAFEAGCEDYCDVDEIEFQGGRSTRGSTTRCSWFR